MRILVFLFVFMLLQLNAEAFNALEENRRHRQELEQQASRQFVQNYQHTKYYKGQPDFLYSPRVRYSSPASSRIASSSKNKSLYVKKGVKFKLSDEDKIKVLKEKQQKELESESKKQVITTKSKVNIKEKNEVIEPEKKVTTKKSGVTPSKATIDKDIKVETNLEVKQNQSSRSETTHNADAE